MNGFQIIKYCRPINLAAMAVSQVVVFLFLCTLTPPNQDTQWPVKIFLSSMAVVFVGAGGYWVNNIFDKKIDQINHPNKILISESFSTDTLWLVYGALNTIGILSSILLGVKPFLCAVFTGILLFIYSYILKKKPLIGNLTVAIVSSFVIIFPLLVLNSTFHEYHPIRMYIYFCVCISLARELIKDVEDIEGDKANGCTTFPITAGIKATKILVAVIIILLAAMIYHFTKNDLMTIRLYFWMMVQLPLSVLLVYTVMANNKNNFSIASRMAKGIMFTGLGSMLLKL